MEVRESYASHDTDNQEAHQAAARRQAIRLIRLATDFDAVVVNLPNGQQYIEEQKAVARVFRDSDSLNIRGRF